MQTPQQFLEDAAAVRPDLSALHNPAVLMAILTANYELAKALQAKDRLIQGALQQMAQPSAPEASAKPWFSS